MTTPRISAEQLRYHRMTQSGLVAPFAHGEAAAHALVGVQAQILPAAALALWNRTSGLSEAAVDDLLYEQRTLVKLWGQRGTLHLYATSDWPLLHGARAVNRTWWERQAEANGITPQERKALIQRVADMLHEHESLGRSDLRSMSLGHEEDEELLSPWGGIFADLVRQGFACHVRRSRGEGRFAHRERWLPHLVWDPPAAHAANLAVAQRFFAAYGPATLQDYLYWRGITRATAQPWLAELQAGLTEVDVDGKPHLIPHDHLEQLLAAPPPAAAWPVRLLYRFDPYVLGHRDKGWVVPAAHYSAVWRPAGHIEGMVLEHGRGAGVWRYDRKGRGLAIQVRPFAPLSSPVADQLPKLAEQVAAFFRRPLLDLQILPV